MESLKSIVAICKQHYEKLLLTLVLLGLGGAVYYLYHQSMDQKVKIEDYFRTKAQQKVKPVQIAELTNFQRAITVLRTPTNLDLALPHNVFNPVKWQKRPDGTILKRERGDEIGPAALRVLSVKPLYLTIAYDRTVGSGYWLVVTNETMPRGSQANRRPLYTALTITNTPILVLREVRPPEDPTEFVVELREDGSRVTITKDQPYQRVLAYEVNLHYEEDPKPLENLRVGRSIRLSGDEYNIVAINPQEVILSAVSNERRFVVRSSLVP